MGNLTDTIGQERAMPEKLQKQLSVVGAAFSRDTRLATAFCVVVPAALLVLKIIVL